MKKIISVCLCFVILLLPIATTFAENAEYALNKVARRAKSDRVLGGKQLFKIGLVYTGCCLFLKDSIEDPNSYNLLLAGSVLMTFSGYYLTKAPSKVEREYENIQSSTDFEEKIAIISRKAKRDKKTRFIGFLILESAGIAFYSSQDPNDENKSSLYAGYYFMGGGLYVFLIRRTLAEKYMKKQQEGYNKTFLITPIIFSNHAGMSIIKRF